MKKRIETLNGSGGDDIVQINAASNTPSQFSYDGLAGVDLVEISLSDAQLRTEAVARSLSAALVTANGNSNSTKPKTINVKIGQSTIAAKNVEGLKVLIDGQDFYLGQVGILTGSQTAIAIKETARSAKGQISFFDLDRGTHQVEVLNTQGLYGTLSAKISDKASNDGVGKVQWTYNADRTKTKELNAGNNASEQFIVRITDRDGNKHEQVVSVTIQGSGSGGIGLINIQNQTAGKVIDGYVFGATVFIDYDGDGEIDEGEPQTQTDDGGNYELLSSRTGGVITAIGGVDRATGLPNTFVYKMAADLGVNTSTTAQLTPLTTLIYLVASQAGGEISAADLAAAEQQIKVAFGIASIESSLLTLEPIEALADPANATAALSTLKLCAQIVMLGQVATTISNGATQSPQSDLLQSLAAQIASSTNESQAIDLSSNEALLALMSASLDFASVLENLSLIEALAQFNKQIAESSDFAQVAEQQSALANFIKNGGGDNGGGEGPVNPLLLTVSVGGDLSINAGEAKEATILVVDVTSGTLANLTVTGVAKNTGNLFQVVASKNDATGSYEFDATQFKDGILKLTAAGTENQTQSFYLTLDRVAPKTPLAGLAKDSTNGLPGYSLDRITNSGTLTAPTNVEPGAIVTYRVKVGGGEFGAWTRSYTTLATNGTADGTYTVEVRQADKAGNISAARSITFTLDTVAPVAPGVQLVTDSTNGQTGNDSDGITNSGALTAPTNLDLGAIVQYRIKKGSGTFSAWSETYAAPATDGSADGAYVVEVRQVDIAGNASTRTLSFTLDTIAATPNAALVTDSSNGTAGFESDSITNSGAITAPTNAEVGALVEYRVQQDAGTFSAWSETYTAPATDGSADGLYIVEVRQTDKAGNVSVIQTINFTLDTIAPATPNALLTTDSTNGGAGFNADVITNRGVITPPSNTELGAVVEYRVQKDAGTFGAWSTTYNAPATDGSADGVYVVEIRQVDKAGNASAIQTINFTLDTTVATPNAALTTDSSNGGAGFDADGITNSGAITAPTNIETDAIVEYRTQRTNGNWTNWSTTYSEPQTSGNADGGYAVEIRQVDKAGNVSTTQTINFTLDTTAPASPNAALATDSTNGGHNLDRDGITNSGALTAVTNAEAGAIVEYRVQKDSGTFSAWSETYTAPATDGTADGVYVVEVRQTDKAGNASTTHTINFTLDTTIPATPNAALTTDSTNGGAGFNTDGVTNSGAITAPANTETGAVVEYRARKDAGEFSAWSAAYTPPLTNGTADGAYEVEIRQVDKVGNVSASQTITFTLDTTIPATPNAALTTDSTNGGTGFGSDGITNSGAITAPTNIETDAIVEYRVRVGNGGQFSAWSSSYTIPATDGTADGVHTVEVRQVDKTGNASATQTITFTLDTALPATPNAALTTDTTNGETGFGTDGITNSGAISAPTNTETGAVVEYRVKKDAGAFSAWSGTYSVPATNGSADGAYVVEIRQTDKAGNVSATKTISYTLDTTAPATPNAALTTDSTNGGTGFGTDGITNSGAITVPTNVEAGAVVEYRVQRNSGNWSNWSTTYSAPSTNGSADGAYVVEIRQTDKAGNVSATQTINFTLDTTVPATPNATLVTDSTNGGQNLDKDGITNSGAITAPTNAETGALVEYRVQKDAGVFSAWSSTYTPPLTNGTADGVYSVEIRQVDKAGNASVTQTITYTLDTTIPATPNAALTTDSTNGEAGYNTDGITNSGAITAPTNTETGAVVEYRVKKDAGTFSAWSGSYTAPLANGTADGVYVVEIRQTDKAGNVSATKTISYTLDTTAPATPNAALTTDSTNGGTGFGTDGITNSGAITAPTNTDTGAIVEYRTRLGNGGQFSAWSSTYTPPLTNGTVDGAYTVEVRQVDKAGNASATQTISFTLDTTVPATPNAALTTDTTNGGTGFGTDGITSSGAITAPTNTETGAVVEYRVKKDAGAFSAWSGTYSAPATDGSADGAYVVEIRQTDKAGNASTAQSISFTLDTIAPATPNAVLTTDSGEGASDGVTKSGAITAPTNSETGAKVEYRISKDGAAYGSWSTSYSAPAVNGTADGVYAVQIRQTDKAGNVSASQTINYTLDATAPTSTMVSAAYDLANDKITFVGTNFSSLLGSGEDATTNIKGRLDWSKFIWDIDGDDATTADVTFSLTDISSAKIINATTLEVVLVSTKADTLESTTNFAGSTADKIDISAGFTQDKAGNASTTDALVNGKIGYKLLGTGSSDILAGGEGNDTIDGGDSADNITGGAGADDLTGGLGADVFVMGRDSIARTAEGLNNMTAASDTITFGNGVDVIRGFVSGTDKLDVTTASNLTQYTAQFDATSSLTANNNYAVRGSFNETTKVFTVGFTGSDTLVLTNAVAASLDAATQTGFVVLIGTSSLVSTDFT